MKTKIIIPIIVLSLVLITKSTLAQTGAPKTVRNQVNQEIQEKKQENKAEVTQIKETKKAALSEAKQKRVQAVYTAIENGLVKRHDALLKIKDKLLARMDKNPTKRDPKSIEAIKSTFEKDFSTADGKYIKNMATLKTQFESIDASLKPSNLTKELKSTVKTIRDDLNAIKKVLKTAIVALAQAPKLEVTKTE